MPYRSPAWMPRYQSPIESPTITSFFGPRPGIGADFHPGLDIQTARAPHEPGILSSATDGTIAGVFTYKDGTQNVLVVGDDGRAILYSGLSVQQDGNVLDNHLKVGDHVATGDPIAETGNTDNKVWHTHVEVLNSQGTAAVGLGQDGSGNWLLRGQPLSSDNQVTKADYIGATRTGNREKPYFLENLLPPEIVFPEFPVVASVARRSAPQSDNWSQETWNAVARDQAVNWGRSVQPIPYLDQTQAADQTLGVASSLRPGDAPNVLSNNRAGVISGAPPKYPAIPYLDQTIAAQRALDNSAPDGTRRQDTAPADFSPRFWFSATNGASAPAPSSSGRRSDAGSVSPTQFAGNAPTGFGAPTANASLASPASSSPSINPLLAATAAYPPIGGFSYASTLQGMADFIGKYMLPSPSPAMADERPPFASLQSGLGTIGADVAPPVPVLTPREQDSLGGGMSGWGASVTGPNAASMAAAPSGANGGSNVPWPPASVFPTAAPPMSYPPPTSPTKTLSYGDMLALAAGLDPAHPDEPPPGGIPGRILEWMRNNPDGVADG